MNHRLWARPAAAIFAALTMAMPVFASLKDASENFLVPCAPKDGKPVLLLYGGFLDVFGEDRDVVSAFFNEEVKDSFSAIVNKAGDPGVSGDFDLFIDGDAKDLLGLVMKGDSGAGVLFKAPYDSEEKGEERTGQRENIPLVVSRLRPRNSGPVVSENLALHGTNGVNWDDYFLLDGSKSNPYDRYSDPSVRRCWIVSWNELKGRWEDFIKRGDVAEVKRHMKVIGDSGRFGMEGGEVWRERIGGFWKANATALSPYVSISNARGLEGVVTVQIGEESRWIEVAPEMGNDWLKLQVPFENPFQKAQITGTFWVVGDRENDDYKDVSISMGKKTLSALDGDLELPRLDRDGLMRKRGIREKDLRDKAQEEKNKERARQADRLVAEAGDARRRGNWDAVRDKAQQALECSPSNPEALKLKREAEKRLAEIETARQGVKKALEAARAAKGSKNWKAVWDNAQQALGYSPSNPEALKLKKEAEERLAEIKAAERKAREEEERKRKEWADFSEKTARLAKSKRSEARNLLRVTHQGRQEWKDKIETLVRGNPDFWPVVTIVNQSGRAVSLSGAVEHTRLENGERLSFAIDCNNPRQGLVYASIYGLQADRDEYVNNAMSVKWPVTWLADDVTVNVTPQTVDMKPDPDVRIASDAGMLRIRVFYAGQSDYEEKDVKGERQASVAILPHREIDRIEIDFAEFETKSLVLSEKIYKRGETGRASISENILIRKVKPAPMYSVSSEVPMNQIVVSYADGTSETFPFVVPMKQSNLKLKPDVGIDVVEIGFSGGYSQYQHRPGRAFAPGATASLDIRENMLKKAMAPVSEDDKLALKDFFDRQMKYYTSAGSQAGVRKRIKALMGGEQEELSPIMKRLMEERPEGTGRERLQGVLENLGLDEDAISKITGIVYP